MARKTPTPKNPRDGDSGKSPKRPRLSLGGFYLFVLLALGLLALQTVLLGGSSSKEVDYSEFLEQVSAGSVDEFTVVNGADITGLYTEAAVEAGEVETETPEAAFGREPDEEARLRFRTTKPADHDLTEYVNVVNTAREEAGEEPVEFAAKFQENWLGGLLHKLMLSSCESVRSAISIRRPPPILAAKFFRVPPLNFAWGKHFGGIRVRVDNYPYCGANAGTRIW